MSLVTVDVGQISPFTWSLALKGSLDASNVETFTRAVADVLARGAKNVILDLGDAQYIASSGFGAFLKLVDETAARQGKVVFVAVPPSIKSIFKIFGLERTLSFADDRVSALGALGPGGERPDS